MQKMLFVMDPIESITPYKDSTLAMMLAAQQRGWQLLYCQLHDLSIVDGVTKARLQPVKVFDDNNHYYDFTAEAETVDLHTVDAVLMRKDPPFDMEYIYATYLLELAEKAGCLVVNKPQSLRDCNEKAFIAQFPQCCVPTLISKNREQIKAFVAEQKQAVLKPLDGMGGASIFKVAANDANLSVILDLMVADNQQTIMAQRFIPEITAGDKRILLVDGKPVDYALARIPAEGEVRGNLAAGGRGVGQPLSERDKELCDIIGPVLRDKGLLFVGLDVIGDYITEINVTSPTCIRELDAQFNLDIAGDLITAIEGKLTNG